MSSFSCLIFFDYENKEVLDMSLQTLNVLGFVPKIMDIHASEEVDLNEAQFEEELLRQHLLTEPSNIKLMNKLYDEETNLYYWFSRRISFGYNVCSFTWHNIDLEFLLNTKEFHRFLESDRFICAFCCDSDDVFRQTNQNINFFEMNYPNAEIPMTKDYMGRSIVDTSNHWGRSMNAGGIKFMAAPLMWFGKRFYDIIPKEQLLSFPYCSIDSSTKSERIVCKLFDWEKNPSKQENREKQRLFWEFFDFKNAIERFNLKRETDIGITDLVNEFNPKKKKKRWF